jgi:hypothetical protein
MAFKVEQPVVFHGTHGPVFKFVEYLTDSQEMAYIRAPLSGKLHITFAADIVEYREEA